MAQADLRPPRLKRWLSAVWRQLCSLKLAVILLIAVAAATVLGSLFPQMPASVAADPAMQAQWLAIARERYGAATAFFHALGFFDLYHTPWFLALLAALLLNTAACTLDRFARIWRATFAPPRVVRPESFYRTGAYHASWPVASARSPAEQAEAIKAALARHRYHLRVEESNGAIYLFAERFRWTRLGTLITHVGLVLLVVGALWSGFGAWREEELTFTPGQVREVGHGHDFALRFDELEIDRYPNGMPREYRVHLAVLEGGEEVLTKVMRLSAPLSYEGVGFYLYAYEPVENAGYSVTLMAVYDPGFWPVIGAASLLLVGMLLTIYFPRRRFWARVTGEEVLLCGRAERGLTPFEGEWEKIIREVEGRKGGKRGKEGTEGGRIKREMRETRETNKGNEGKEGKEVRALKELHA